MNYCITCPDCKLRPVKINEHQACPGLKFELINFYPIP